MSFTLSLLLFSQVDITYTNGLWPPGLHCQKICKKELNLLNLCFQIGMIDEFFSANGPKGLIFYYEEIPQKTAEGDFVKQFINLIENQSVSIFSAPLGKTAKPIKKLYVTDGTQQAFPGMGLFFLRTTNKAITTANIAQETNFGVLESNGGGLLEAIENLLRSVFLPALRDQTSWGELSKDASGHVAKENFIGKLDGFVSILANARKSIQDAASLSPCSNPAITAITTPLEAISAAHNAEIVEAAESCAIRWCKEIEQVIYLPFHLTPLLKQFIYFFFV